MCTDVALYVLHARARIVPLPVGDDRQQYDKRCGATTVRMSLETMYPSWFTNHSLASHVMLVNHEHLWLHNLPQHRRIDFFLCKTHIAYRTLQKYIRKHQLHAKAWYMGHTSQDILMLAADNHTSAHMLQTHKHWDQALHVKGKSGLKHTEQLLDCWAERPDFPLLTVVGDVSYELQSTQRALNASNIRILPQPQAAASADPYKSNPRMMSAAEVMHLQSSTGLQICVSEREGFGHYLNEARAAGAVVITTDHPPMNELISHMHNGLLVKPARTDSYPDIQALGNLTHLNAFVEATSICAAVEAALQLPVVERQRLGAEARSAYLRGKRAWQHRLKAWWRHMSVGQRGELSDE
eukprot:jgi/Chrzof1/13394/Cz07g31120.t1